MNYSLYILALHCYYGAYGDWYLPWGEILMLVGRQDHWQCHDSRSMIRKQPTQFNFASNHSLHSRYRHTTKPLVTIDHVKFPRNLGRACPYDTFVCCPLVSTISFVYLPGGILDASHRRSSALPDGVHQTRGFPPTIHKNSERAGAQSKGINFSVE